MQSAEISKIKIDLKSQQKVLLSKYSTWLTEKADLYADIYKNLSLLSLFDILNIIA